MLVEYFRNNLEKDENVVSFIGAIILTLQVEIFYHLSRKFDIFARYSGIVMFSSFGIYMAEITVQNTY